LILVRIERFPVVLRHANLYSKCLWGTEVSNNKIRYHLVFKKWK